MVSQKVLDSGREERRAANSLMSSASHVLNLGRLQGDFYHG